MAKKSKSKRQQKKLNKSSLPTTTPQLLLQFKKSWQNQNYNQAEIAYHSWCKKANRKIDLQIVCELLFRKAQK